MPRYRRASISSEEYDWEDRFRPVRHHRRPRASSRPNLNVYDSRSYSSSRPGREPVYIFNHNDLLSPDRDSSPPRRARSMSRAPRREFVDSLEDRVRDKNLDRLASNLAAAPRPDRSHSRRPRRSSSSSRDDSDYRRQLRKLKQRELDYEDQLRQLKRGKQGEKEIEDRLEEMAKNKQRQRDYDDQLEDLKRERERLRRRESESEHGKRREDVRRDIEQELKLEELRELHEKAAKKKYLEDALLAEKISTLEKEREDKSYEKKIREKIENERIKAELEELERVQRENKLKEDAIEAFKREETERELQRREAEEKAEAEFQERLKQYYGNNVPPVQKEAAPLAIQDKPHRPSPVDKPEAAWAKVHRQWICPETLMAFRIPWEYDDQDADYLLINCWLDKPLQEQLFRHTSDLREDRLKEDQKLIAAAPAEPMPQQQPALIEMKINDRERDKMFLVKKKKERRGLSFFR